MAREPRRALGTAGEDAAATWLEARGYCILARNARTRYGEIDLVARAGDVVVFVEVKSRTSARFGHPVEAIALPKQRRLARLAAAFIQGRRLGDCQVRFDAVAVYLDASGRVRAIEHLPDAFRVGG